jgi:hypothetical protein
VYAMQRIPILQRNWIMLLWVLIKYIMFPYLMALAVNPHPELELLSYRACPIAVENR